MKFTLSINCFICLATLLVFLETEFLFFSSGKYYFNVIHLFWVDITMFLLTPFQVAVDWTKRKQITQAGSPIFILDTNERDWFSFSLVVEKAPSWEICKLLVGRLSIKQRKLICRESYWFNMEKNGERLWRARTLTAFGWNLDQSLFLSFVQFFLPQSHRLHNSSFGLKEF